MPLDATHEGETLDCLMEADKDDANLLFTWTITQKGVSETTSNVIIPQNYTINSGNLSKLKLSATR